MIKFVFLEVIVICLFFNIFKVNVFLGSFWMILLKKWVCKIIDLVDLICIFVFLFLIDKKVLIDILVLFFVKVKFFCVSVIFIFVKIGIVVLFEIVCWIVCNFCIKLVWFKVIFMMYFFWMFVYY